MQVSVSGGSSAKQNAQVEVIDIRGIQAPDNVLTVLKRVSELSPTNGPLEIRADNNPFQLYDLLQQRGFFLEVKQQKDGSYAGTIRPREIEKLKN